MAITDTRKWGDFHAKRFAPGQYVAVKGWEPATADTNRFEGTVECLLPGAFRLERIEFEHQETADTGARADEDRDTCLRASYFPQYLQTREVTAEMGEFRRDLVEEDWIDFRSYSHTFEYGEEFDQGRIEVYAAHTVTGVPIICRLILQSLGTRWAM